MTKPLVLLFSLLISFNSYASDWEFIVGGDDYPGDDYIDKNTIKEHDGYVYFWMLTNYPVDPVINELGLMSIKSYFQADCGIDRFRLLTTYGYKLPMAEGEIEKEETYENRKWKYVPPDTIGEKFLNYVCN